MSRPAFAEINLSALKENYAYAKALAPGSETLAVVKANAYGHGAAQVSPALEPMVPLFAVACIEEAEALRAAGIKKPILLLEGCFDADELQVASEQNFQLVVHSEVQLHAIERAKLRTAVKVWLKVDSGMHRLGVAPQQAETFYQRLKKCSAASDDTVLMSHFACADEPQHPMTSTQLTCFNNVLEKLGGESSLANSAALMACPESHRHWNRPGIMLYGISPFQHPLPVAEKLQPVMTLKSRIIGLRQIKASDGVGYGMSWQASQNATIATIAMGYGDGYPRNARNGTPVLIQGQQAPLAGRVSMDMLTVDVSHLPDVQIGDEVTLWGNGLDVNTVAAWADTIGYELVTRLSGRVIPRYIL